MMEGGQCFRCLYGIEVRLSSRITRESLILSRSGVSEWIGRCFVFHVEHRASFFWEFAVAAVGIDGSWWEAQALVIVWSPPYGVPRLQRGGTGPSAALILIVDPCLISAFP